MLGDMTAPPQTFLTAGSVNPTEGSTSDKRLISLLDLPSGASADRSSWMFSHATTGGSSSQNVLQLSMLHDSATGGTWSPEFLTTPAGSPETDATSPAPTAAATGVDGLMGQSSSMSRRAQRRIEQQLESERNRERQADEASRRGLRNLFIAWLPPTFTDLDLSTMASAVGAISSCRVIHEERRSYGFVMFEDSAAAAEAVKHLGRQVVNGRRLQVHLSKKGSASASSRPSTALDASTSVNRDTATPPASTSPSGYVQWTPSPQSFATLSPSLASTSLPPPLMHAHHLQHQQHQQQYFSPAPPASAQPSQEWFLMAPPSSTGTSGMPQQHQHQHQPHLSPSFQLPTILTTPPPPQGYHHHHHHHHHHHPQAPSQPPFTLQAPNATYWSPMGSSVLPDPSALHMQAPISQSPHQFTTSQHRSPSLLPDSSFNWSANVPSATPSWPPMQAYQATSPSPTTSHGAGVLDASQLASLASYQQQQQHHAATQHQPHPSMHMPPPPPNQAPHHPQQQQQQQQHHHHYASVPHHGSLQLRQ